MYNMKNDLHWKNCQFNLAHKVQELKLFWMKLNWEKSNQCRLR